MSDFAQRYGPWALVTGASDGIGRATALDAARRGLNIILVARRGAELAEVAAQINKYKVQTRIIVADLSRPADVQQVIGATADVDLGLFVAAAGFGTAGRFIDIDVVDEVAMLDVNCRAVVVMTHAIARGMAARGRGGIILFSSVVAFQGTANAAHYAATKGYVQLLAEGLHRELRPLGVDVLACAPGPVTSGFAARSNLKMGAAAKPQTVARATLNALGKRTIVRPGFLSKLLIYGLATLPRALRGAMISKIMGGMTNHQQYGIKLGS